MQRVIGFHYTLTDQAGDIIDSSSGQDPLYYLENTQSIIPGLEKVLALMNVGDKRKIEVKAQDAYGEKNQELVLKVNKNQFPEGANLNTGDQFQVNEHPESPIFTIVQINDTEVTIDGNHPMAGKDLFFDVEIVAIRDATKEELSHGHIHGHDGKMTH